MIIQSNKKNLYNTSPMPFGEYKGEKMRNVPASYLHQLWTEGGFRENMKNPVSRYIRDNIRDLEQEYPDGIWT